MLKNHSKSWSWMEWIFAFGWLAGAVFGNPHPISSMYAPLYHLKRTKTMKNVFTLQTFTLREIAEAENEPYQNILNRKARGEYVAVAIQNGSNANTKTSYRYLSKRMSEVVLTLAKERLLDGAVASDEKSAIIAKKRR